MADARRFDSLERTVRELRRELTDARSTILARLGSHTHGDSGGGGAVESVNGQTGTVTLDADDVGAQPIDSDLTSIAALTPSNDDVIQRKSGSWVSRTIAQLKVDLSLATVATTGDYDDLSDKPALGTAAAADADDFATSAQGGLADSSVQPGDLAEVATSGAYSDLSGTPSIPASPGDIGAQPADADLTAIAGLTPTDGDLMARVAGAWAAFDPADLAVSDATQDALDGKSDVGHNHDSRYYTETETDALLAGFATVATSGDYDDLTNKPTIPSQYTDEQVRDVMGTALVAGSNVTITPDDGANTITIAATGGGGGGAVDSVNGQTGDVSLDYVDVGAQQADADLTAIAGLSPTNNDILQRKSGAWTNRTPSQLKTDLSLGNVTNDAQVAKSLIDAKGDLLVGSADDTPARLAVGSNGQVLTADSSQSAGVKWSAPAGAPISCYATSDTTRNNSTTLLDVTGMAMSLATGTYAIEGWLLYLTNDTADVKLGWSTPTIDSGSAWNVYGIVHTTGAFVTSNSADYLANAFTIAKQIGGNGLGIEMTAQLLGHIIVTASGTLQLRFSQNTANASNTIVRKGSWLKATKLA